MKALILTDAEDKSQVLVIFGGGSVTMAKSALDADGTYTEIFNGEGEIVATVTESLTSIKSSLERT